MKCVFVRNVDVDPSTMSDSEKAKIKYRMNAVAGVVRPIPYFEAGTEYEAPDAFVHCRTGNAAPADPECTVACGMTPAELATAQRKQKRAAAGILPEDYELYDAGVITGYVYETGEYVPGPNWKPWKEAQDAAKAQETSGTDI